MDMLSPDSIMKWLSRLAGKKHKYKPEDQKNAPARDSTPARDSIPTYNIRGGGKTLIPQYLIDIFGGNK